MRLVPHIGREVVNGVLLVAVSTGFNPLLSQELSTPDFSQAALATPGEDVSGAWMRWRLADRGLEQKIFRLPMSEARDILQRSLGRFEDFLEKRGAYATAMAAHIESRRAAVRPRGPEVTTEAVYRNHIDILGLTMSTLQERLASLRDSSDWLAIRRSVQTASNQVLALSAARRAETPLDVSLRESAPLSPISVVTYRESEQQLAQTLRKLWTTYYQALIDAVEKNLNGPVPLQPVRSLGRTVTASTLPPIPGIATAESQVAGVWKYVEGSQQFNGVGEPRDVLLELWTEGGALQGRYRAELPDFHGSKKVDVRLRRIASAPAGQLSFTFDSFDPPASGRIMLEGPGPTGMELMLVRVVSSLSPIPRGREVLQRY